VANVCLRGFTEAGLVLQGVSVFGEPVRVERVRCESNSPSAVGFKIEPRLVGSAADDSKNISIAKCRWDGPLAAGVSIHGKGPYALSVQESLFVETAVGIRFESDGRWRDITLTNNTFFRCPIGIVFTAMPNPLTSGLAIRRNLFVGTATAEAVVQSGYDESAFLGMLSDPVHGLEWNWSDRPSPAVPAPGEINLFANQGRRGETGFAFVSTDPKHPQFLAPSQGSPQRSAPGPRGTEKAWVGAIGP
jgi:hypothetical protein